MTPLVPPEVDLRDFPFMPLEVVRLRDSDLAAVSSAEGFRAAVLLWCAAWHQVPAGSIPADHRMQARLAGFGRDVEAWEKVKDEALHRFVECDDGRLYHPTIAEKAIEAWQRKLKQRARVQGALDARRNVERDVPRRPQRNVHQGTGTVDRETPSPTPPPAKDAADAAEGGDFLKSLLNAYPPTRGFSRPKLLAKIRGMPEADRAQLLAGARAYAVEFKAKPTTHPIGVERFVSDSLFLNFTGPPGRPNRPRLVAVPRDSPQGAAHEAANRAGGGRGVPWSGGVWYFETEWPSGHDPDGSESNAKPVSRRERGTHPLGRENITGRPGMGLSFAAGLGQFAEAL